MKALLPITGLLIIILFGGCQKEVAISNYVVGSYRVSGITCRYGPSGPGDTVQLIDTIITITKAGNSSVIISEDTLLYQGDTNSSYRFFYQSYYDGTYASLNFFKAENDSVSITSSFGYTLIGGRITNLYGRKAN